MSIIVTGMHRSGTSLVARLVESYGLVSGSPDMMGPAADNPRGFFERRDVSAFNDRWLDRLGGTWWAPPSTTAFTWRHFDEEAIDAARKELDLFSVDAPAWYSKDPRTALLLPLWDRLALCEHPTVVCLRHPDQVALSLGLRNGFSARRALALWMAYTVAAVRHAGDRPTLVIDYGQLLEHPSHGLDALGRFLRSTGHEPNPAWSPSEAVRLIEPNLLRAEARGRGADPLLWCEPVYALYHQLAEWHGRSLGAVSSLVLPEWVSEALDELRELMVARRAAAVVPATAAIDDATREELARLTRCEVEQQARLECEVQRAEVLVAEVQRLHGALQELELAIDAEQERTNRAELGLVDPPVPGTDATVPGETFTNLVELAVARAAALGEELARLRAENEKRRTAMAEMSAELERRRARAYRAETAVAELQLELTQLQATERGRRGTQEELLVARFERDNLRHALADRIERHLQATEAVDALLGARSWRWGRALTAPGRLARRAYRRRP